MKPEFPLPWSCVVVNYNGAAVLEQTLRSIKRLRTPPSEIIVADDGSSDDSLEIARAAHPDIVIHALPANSGRTSRVRNLGLRHAREDLVLVTDNDIEFDADCVDNLIAVMASDPLVAVCTPLILVGDGSDEVFARGHPLHFLCWSVDEGPVTAAALQEEGVRPGVGCGIALVRRSAVLEAGGFDEDLVIGWGDDGEMHQRMRLFGYEALSVPDAIGFHRRIRSQPRVKGQIYNRFVMIAKHYRLHTLVLLAPCFLVFDGFMILFLFAKGHGGDYFAAAAEAFRARASLLAGRRRIQERRTVPDRAVLDSGRLALTRRLSNPVLTGAVGALNGLFSLWWSAAKRLV